MGQPKQPRRQLGQAELAQIEEAGAVPGLGGDALEGDGLPVELLLHTRHCGTQGRGG